MLLLLKDTKCNILKLSDGSLMDLIKNSTSNNKIAEYSSQLAECYSYS